MLTNIIKQTWLAVIIIMALGLNAEAGDLSDDIKADEKITKYDELGRPGTNVQYIIRNAKASTADERKTKKGSGDMAIGGLINKPGAKVGDVTIVFNGKDINAISK